MTNAQGQPVHPTDYAIFCRNNYSAAKLQATAPRSAWAFISRLREAH